MTDKIENLCLKIKNMEKLEDFVLVDDEKNTITTLITFAISKNVVDILNRELTIIKQLINEDNPLSEGNFLTVKEINRQLDWLRNGPPPETTEETTE